MEESVSKYQMIVGQWLEEGGNISLPLDLPWPVRLKWDSGKWEMLPESGINVFLLMQAAKNNSYASGFWISLRDAEKAGGVLREGQGGVQVASWRWRNTDQNFKGDLAQKIGAVAKQALPMEKEDSPKAIALRPEVLFNAKQWKGLESLPESTYRMPSVSDAMERSKKIAKDHAPCEVRQTDSSQKAFYNPSQNYIQISAPETYETLSGYYTDLFEQFGHALASKHNLDLFSNEQLEEFSSDVEFKTLYAKMLSAMLAYHSGCELLK